jgi:hypothetical protein
MYHHHTCVTGYSKWSGTWSIFLYHSNYAQSKIDQKIDRESIWYPRDTLNHTPGTLYHRYPKSCDGCTSKNRFFGLTYTIPISRSAKYVLEGKLIPFERRGGEARGPRGLTLLRQKGLTNGIPKYVGVIHCVKKA